MSHLEKSPNSSDDTPIPKEDDHLSVKNQGEEPTSSSSTTNVDSPYTSSWFQLAERGDYFSMYGTLTIERVVADRSLTDKGDTALHVAASAGNLGTMTALLDVGADVNFRGDRLRTPLHRAAAHGHLAVAQGLLDKGAAIAAKDADGLTPLDLAERNGHADVVGMLKERIGQKSDVKLMTTAVLQGDKASVEKFLEKGLSADECDESGEPVLVLAAEAKRWDVVNLLLEKGASPTACKEDAKCALVLASREGQAEVVRHLLRHGAAAEAEQVKEALGAACSAAVVRAFVDEVPKHVCGEGGRWGLLEAAWNGRLEPLVALLDAGVSVNAKNNVNQTPLFFASWKGHVECVRELLRRGADADAVGNSGNTPLHMACMNGHSECVSELLAAGASTLSRNNAGKKPLDVAKTDGVHRIFAEHRVRSAARSVSK